MAPRASLDLAHGLLQLAAQRVPVRALGAGGRLQLGDDDGPVFRPATFGERTRLVATSLGAADPALALASALADALRVHPGAADAAIERVLALLLAGAGTAAPPLVETACLVARATTSSLASVESLDAAQVDFYANGLADDEGSEVDWHRVILAPSVSRPTQATGGAADVETIVRELAESLLVRGRARASAATRELAVRGVSNGGTGLVPPPRAAGDAADAALRPAAAASHSARAHAEAPTINGGHHHVPDTAAPVSSPTSTTGAAADDASAPLHSAFPTLMRFRQPGRGRDVAAPAENDAEESGTARAVLASPAGLVARPAAWDAKEDAFAHSSMAANAPLSTGPSVDRPAEPWPSGDVEPRRRSGRRATVAAFAGDPVLTMLDDAAAPHARRAAADAVTPSRAPSPDDLCDLVADVLRLEATRRGLVP